MTFSNLCDALSLPHAVFNEDEWTMNGMTTAFAGIVPNEVYDFDLSAYDLRIVLNQPHYTGTSGGFADYKIPEVTEPAYVELCRFLKGFKLAV